jgi:hypothetical protein
MTNEFELNDEQLAAVTGGKSIDITKLTGTARNSFNQNSFVDGSTGLFVLGGGKKSTTEGVVEGATIHAGNGATGLNIVSL